MCELTILDLASSNLISWTERLRQFWQPTISCWRKKIT